MHPTPNPLREARTRPIPSGRRTAAISPDGKFLALIAMRNSHTQLWLRPLDASDAQPIAGSEDAANPFWSPDSRHFPGRKISRPDRHAEQSYPALAQTAG